MPAPTFTLRAIELALGSLDCAGFASAAEPEWSSMQPLPAVAPEGVPVP